MSRTPLLVAAALVASAVGVVAAQSALARPSAGPEQLAARAQVHVVPAEALTGFLAARSVEGAVPLGGDAPYVVARVTWSAGGAAGDDVSVLLGDRRGRPGQVQAVLGVPPASVTLGSGSVWDEALRDDPALAGGAAQCDAAGCTTHGQLATLPAGPGREVWVVGRVVAPDGAPVGDPEPVLALAFSDRDRVWWTDRVAQEGGGPAPGG